MANLTHILRQAARRQMLNRALRLGGFGAAFGAAAALVLLVVDRAAGIAVPSGVYVGLCAGGLVIGSAVALMRRPDPLDVATHLDRLMHLRDRLGSAVAVQRGLVQTPRAAQQAFAQWTVHDAERTAAGIAVRRAVPIRLTNIWNVSLVLCAVLAVGVVFLPRVSRADSSQRQALGEERAAALEAERTELQQSIQSTVQELQSQPIDDPRVAQQLEALRELEQQLAEQPPDADSLAEARDESAARINDVAERLDEQARRDQQARDALARDFEKLEPAEAPPTTRELIEQLRQGDLNNVADELQRLLDQSQQLDDAQRREAAESLRSTRDALQSDDQPSPAKGEMRRQLEQVLREQGLDEQAIEELTEPQSPRNERELADELMSHGIEEPVARELSEQLHQRDQQRDAQQRSEQDRHTLRDALDRAAEQLDQPREPQADQPNEDATSPEQTEQQQSQEQGQQPDQQQSQEQQQQGRPEGESQQSQQSQQSGESSSSQQQQQQQSQRPGREHSAGDAPQSQSQSQQQQPGSEQQPAAGEQSESPQQSGDDRAAPQQSPDGSQQPVASEQSESQQPNAQEQSREETTTPQQTPAGEQQPGAQQQTPGEQGAAEQPTATEQQRDDGSQQPGAAQDSAQQQQQQQQQQQAQDKSPAEMIRELQNRRDAMERWRNMSEQSRQRAREMADRMSDEQKQRWMRELQRQQGEMEPGGERSDEDQPQRAGGGPGSEPGEQPEPAEGSQYAPQGTEPLDARGDEQGADQLISEWLSDQPRTDSPGTTESVGDSEPVRRAQDFARRAVSESVVPRRYHRMIDRYFGRLPDIFESAGASSRSGDSTSSSSSDDSGAAQP